MDRSIAYDDIAVGYARHRGIQPFVVETLQRLHALSPGGPILEVGCGTGDYITALAQPHSGLRYGMDPSYRMLQRTPDRTWVAYVQGQAANLPFADRSLDMIFSVNVVHHIVDVEPYLQESFRALAPRGILCTATDSRAIIERRKPLSRYWPSTVPVELDRYHAVEELGGAMAAVGFRSVDVWEGYCEFTVSDSGPYRDKAFSCLRLISEEDFSRGLLAMEADLRTGPVEANSELAFLWGRHP